MREDRFLKPVVYESKRIRDIVKQAAEKRIVFLTAPLGYGKTAVVQNFLAGMPDCRHEWFYFDATGEAAHFFWDKLVQTMPESRQVELATDMEEYVVKGYYEMQKLSFALNEALQQDTYFILEDYHLYDNPKFNQFLEALAYCDIPKLHIFIIGRKYPSIPYLEMEIRGCAERIGIHDLCLSRSEVEDFFEINNCNPGKEACDAIVEYTRGWLSAVYLLCMNYLQHQEYRGKRMLALLVRDSIFNKLSANEQRILLSISVLSSCMPEQAIVLTEQEDAMRILFQMEEEIAFVHYNSERGFYFDEIFVDVLREERLRKGITREEILKRNIKYLLQQQNYLKAIKECFELNLYEEIFKIFKKYIQLPASREDAEEYYRIFLKVPLENKVRNLKIYVQFISYYIIKIDYIKGGRLAEELTEVLESIDLPKEDDELICQLVMMMLMWHFNHIEAMLQHAGSMLRQIRASGVGLYEREVYKLVAVPHLLRILHNEPGKIQYNISLLNREEAIFSDVYVCSTLDIFHMLEAEHAYETGNLEEAVRRAEVIRTEGLYQNSPMKVIGASSILAHTALVEARREIYESLIQQMVNYAEELTVLGEGDVYVKETVLVLSSLVSIDEHSTNMSQWIGGMNDDDYNSITRMSGLLHITEGQLLAREKKFVELEMLAEELLKDGLLNFQYRKIYGMLFLAWAKYYTGKTELGIKMFYRVIEICEADHIVSPFLENATLTMPLMKWIADNEFVEDVRLLCEKRMEAECMNDNRQVLSAREAEVMDLITKGYKNTEIADKLHVALVTVEKNVSSIYRKLDVKNRAGAILKWREL